LTAAPRACRITRLRLYQFRNYSDETIQLGPGLNVLSGANAQGKTNLLEAVAVLALTRSPRAASAETIAWGADVCRVEGLVSRPQGPALLDIRVSRPATGSGSAPQPGVGASDGTVRTTLLDGKERSARSLLGICPVVLFWPDDLLLVKGGPEGRRRLLDVLLSQLDPRAADDLVRCRRILDQRNALLRQVRAGQASAAPLSGFTLALAQSGGAVRAARARLISDLSPLATDALAELSGGREELRLRYLASGVPLDAVDAAGAAAELRAELDRRTGEELARGVTVAGPQRDDLEILVDGRPARTAASQGQQRSIVLACKLAEVRHLQTVATMAPVLLLDDVLSELDPDRRRRLLQGVGAGIRLQALITTSETATLDLLDDVEVRSFRVQAGHVSPAADDTRTSRAGAAP